MIKEKFDRESVMREVVADLFDRNFVPDFSVVQDIMKKSDQHDTNQGRSTDLDLRKDVDKWGYNDYTGSPEKIRKEIEDKCKQYIEDNYKKWNEDHDIRT